MFNIKITHQNGESFIEEVEAENETAALEEAKSIASGISSIDWPRSDDCEVELV